MKFTMALLSTWTPLITNTLMTLYMKFFVWTEQKDILSNQSFQECNS